MYPTVINEQPKKQYGIKTLLESKNMRPFSFSPKIESVQAEPITQPVEKVSLEEKLIALDSQFNQQKERVGQLMQLT